MVRKPKRLTADETLEILNQHKHRGFDDWKVTSDFTEVYSERQYEEIPEFYFLIWEARAIADRYIMFVENGWIQPTDMIQLIDATDAPES